MSFLPHDGPQVPDAVTDPSKRRQLAVAQRFVTSTNRRRRPSGPRQGFPGLGLNTPPALGALGNRKRKIRGPDDGPDSAAPIEDFFVRGKANSGTMTTVCCCLRVGY